MPLLDTVFYHNTVLTWIIAVGVMTAVFAVLRLLKAVFHRRFAASAKKTATDLDGLVAGLIRRIKLYFLLAVALYAGSQFLTLPETLKAFLQKLVVVAFLLQAVVWGGAVLDFLIHRARKKKGEEDKAGLTTFSALAFAGRLVLWSVALLLVLDNLGVDITTLVAGLGVGGIAVALALQSILGDLFASMSIVLDKPFVIDDFIVVDDLRGTVKHIGLKTTRIASLSGEEIVFANSDLLNSRVRNFKRMAERRITFNIGVTYQTPAGKLEAIPGMIREIVEAQERTRFDRSHFQAYGDFALIFETVYFMTVPDYAAYMDTQQAINFALYRKFEAEGIEFAYPTQTIFLNKPAA
jgi:small-conductance mechanosensitive channel